MKVFFGNAPWRQKGLYGVRAGSRWPHLEDDTANYMPFPFFMAYAQAVAEKEGHKTLMVDAIAEDVSESEFLRRMKAFSPDVIVMEVSTPSYGVDIQVARKARAMLPDAKMFFAGLHAEMYNIEFLDRTPETDFVMIGEYEYILRDALKALANDGDFSQVGGLLYRDKNGASQSTGRRETINQLDELPWPMRRDLKMDRYHDEPGGIPAPSLQMWTSRGCPYTCTFCVFPQVVYGNNKYRVRSPKDVVDEIEHCVKEHGVQSVYFDDDTFNIGKPRMYALCEELEKRNLNIPWAVMARADTSDEETLRRMHAAGLRALKFGVESADQNIVDDVGKRLDLGKVRRSVALCHELGIRLHLTFIFGLPGETRGSMQQTLDLALELNPDTLQFSIATPFPGSKLYEQMQDEGRLSTDDFSKFDGFHSAVVSTDELTSKEIEDFVADATKIFAEHCRTRKRKGAIRKTACQTSVIIPAWNSREHIIRCLIGLEESDDKSFEVIVVDGGSKDETTQMLEESYPWVHVIALPENRGFAGNVNAGIKDANGAYIAVLNADAKPSPSWLSNLRKPMDEDEHVGVCASRVVEFLDMNTLQSAGDGLTRGMYPFQIGHGRKVELTDTPFWQTNGHPWHTVFGASACAALYRREVIEDTGGFDEDFFAYLEDVDLSFRARHLGWEVVFVRDAIVEHVGHSTYGKQYTPETVYLLGRNWVNLVVKNVPRKVFWKNFGSIALRPLIEFARHTKNPGLAVSYFGGVAKGLLDARKSLKKRRKVLGSRKSTDEEVLSWLEESERVLSVANSLPRATNGK
ncbi:MAG: glycosyltransferase [Planctomycetes bacterium]|nr:glycosyltransferase [Planctomycetota bacterium]